MLPPRIVVSYADPLWGHYGYIYRALNFRYAGWTDMERKTPRYDYIPLPKRKTYEWPGGKRIAFCINNNIENSDSDIYTAEVLARGPVFTLPAGDGRQPAVADDG